MDFVEQQKRIEHRQSARAERAPKLDPGPFDGGDRIHEKSNVSFARRARGRSERLGPVRRVARGKRGGCRNTERQRADEITSGERTRHAAKAYHGS
jgi:hypothetical protein